MDVPVRKVVNFSTILPRTICTPITKMDFGKYVDFNRIVMIAMADLCILTSKRDSVTRVGTFFNGYT